MSNECGRTLWPMVGSSSDKHYISTQADLQSNDPGAKIFDIPNRLNTIT